MMSSGPQQSTFYLPLVGEISALCSALSKGNFSFGNFSFGSGSNEQASADAQEYYVGDYENINLKYLEDPAQFLPTDWPLVLCGPSGTGKTSIALSLAYRIRNKSSKNACLFTAADFGRRFAHALETNSMDQFVDSILGACVVVIDDVQLLATFPGAQLQLISLLDELNRRGVPSIFTVSEVGLMDLKLDPKLTSRLTNGLCLPVKKPGVAARRAIILSFVRQYALSIPESVTDYLASVLKVSYSAIRSFFANLMVWLQSRKRPVSMIYKDTIMEFLAESFGSANKAAIDRIMKLVSTELGIKIADIKSKSRQKSTVFARSIAGYFLRHYMGMSYATIGKVLGNRDHSTIMHSLNRIESGLLKNNTEIVPVLKKIEGFVVEMLLFSSPANSGKPVEQM